MNHWRHISVPIVDHLTSFGALHHTPFGQRDLQNDALAEEGSDRIDRPLALLINLHIHVFGQLTGVEQPVVEALVHAARHTCIVGFGSAFPVSHYWVQLLHHQIGL